MEKIQKWQIWGVVITVILGSLLHFVFDWSGGSKIVALFAAVNESTWEHLKIGFWPALIFLTIEYFYFGKNNKNFCLAAAKTLYTIPILIVALFYGYTAIIEDNLFMDILIFIVAIIAAFVIGYYFLKTERDFSKYKTISIIFILIIIAAFSLLTYFPAKNFLFLDPVSGGYGI